MKKRILIILMCCMCLQAASIYGLETELRTLTGQLNALATALAAQVPLPPTPQSSSEKISNEKLWAEIYRRNPSFTPLREIYHCRSSGPWVEIENAHATTRTEVENALIQYLLKYRGWNNANYVFPQQVLDRFEEYIQHPSPELLNRRISGMD